MIVKDIKNIESLMFDCDIMTFDNDIVGNGDCKTSIFLFDFKNAITKWNKLTEYSKIRNTTIFKEHKEND